MLKKILTCLLAFVSICSLYASGLPQASDGTNTHWYLIKFSEGGFVFEGKTNDAGLRNETATGSDAQLWKFVGSEADGFTIINKLGYSIYVTQADKNNGSVKVATNPTSGSKFKLVTTENTNHPGTFEILPVGNMGIGLNLAGGVQWRNGNVGMWDKKDINNCLTFVPATEYEIQKNISVIPYPQDLKVIKGGALNFNTLKSISCTDAKMAIHLQNFVAQLKKVSGISLNVVEGAASIEMTTDAKLSAEGYTLQVNDKGIVIKAKQTAGFFYALQTLKQLLPNAYFGKQLNTKVAWTVPFVDINDQPALGHRGFMLDVSRHFFTKEEVMRILDVMSLYKMNIFHWHLTDDQGWRIEIPEYPRLTEVGSIRKASQSSSGFWDDTEYGRGMWYSQQDLKEVVAYAAERNINIIPEVDFPGHMMGAVTAYPELSCDPTKTYELRVWGGISKDVLNIGNDEVIKFLKTILDNLAKIFPYQYIHFGGDECPTDQWATNELCLKRVKDKGLAGVQELQSWLIEELGTYVKTKYNRDIMVWDELTQHWNTKNTIKPVVMCWHNNNDAANNKGLHTITCPHDYTYLDMMQVDKNHALIDEPYRGGWNDDKVTTVEKTYSLNPHYKTMNNPYNVLGVQANMWTETTNDNEELEYQVFPRLIATAEVGWLPVNKKDWSSFHQRLQSHDEILDAMGVNYAKHYITPKQLTEKEAALKEAENIILQSVKGGVGYPSAAEYEALQSAFTATQAEGSDVAALKTAINAYKSAEIVQPVVGKMYQIFSASTNYKFQFAGSSLYQSAHGLRIHYTPQTEPEELWEFVTVNGKTYLQNVGSKQQVTLATSNSAAGLATTGTPVVMKKATKANGGYSYIPGAVTLCAAEEAAKGLVAQISGDVNVADDKALCNPGTWTLVEVNDFKAQLQGLCNKCESILRKAKPGEFGEPTPNAIDFLINEVLTPAQADLNQEVTEAVYKQHLAKYDQFVQMPKKERLKATNLEMAATSGKSFALSTSRDALIVVPGGTAIQTLTEAKFAADYNNASQQFAFVKRGSNYYLYSVRAQKFVKKDNTLSGDKGDAVTFKAGNPYIFVGNGNPTKNDREGAQRIILGGDRAINVDGAKTAKLISWGCGDGQTDDGNSFYIEEAADFAMEVVKASQLEADGSFGAGMHWYQLALPNVKIASKADCMVQSSEAGVVDSKEEYNNKKDFGQYFAFVKHENGGYLIYNYAAGPNKVLWSADLDAGETPSQLVSMMDKTAAPQTWSFEANTFKDAQYFGYALTRTDKANSYISRKGNNLGFWVAGGATKDAHSCFHLMEVNIEDVIREAEALMRVPFGAVGTNAYFADPVKQANFEKAYQNAKANPHNFEYADALSSLTAEAKACKDLVAFDANRLYRLQNVMNGGILNVNGTTLVPSTMDVTNANLLWKISAVGGDATVQHMNSEMFISDMNKVAANHGGFKVTNITGTTAEFGIHKMIGNQDKYICHNKNRNEILGWHEPSVGGDHGWYLIPATALEVNMATIGEKSYASLYLPFSVTLPEGLTAYTGVLNAEKTSLKMKALGNQLPKNTGVVLEGQKGISTVALTILNSELTEVSENNLIGTNIPKSITANDPAYWVLGNHETDGIGFYHLNATTLAANKAFLFVTNAPANGIRLDFGEVTGVEEVETETEENVVYDLSGRRVTIMTKGLYIVNGKKMYVK